MFRLLLSHLPGELNLIKLLNMNFFVRWQLVYKYMLLCSCAVVALCFLPEQETQNTVWVKFKVSYFAGGGTCIYYWI